MRTNSLSLFVALGLLLKQAASAFGAEVTARVIDRLGRPVTSAVVDVHWLKSVSEDDVRRVVLVKLVSDSNGIVKGSYDEAAIPPDETLWMEVSKEGYGGYSTTGLHAELVLEREFGPEDIRRIAALQGAPQVRELRELLAGDFDHSGDGPDELVFVQEHRFRPGLRTLVSDAKIGTAASRLLAFIGGPEDLRLVVAHAPQPKRELFEDRWAYGVVCALLEPTTEKEWAFLRSCALNEYDDLWVDAGAIETLKLIASPRSRQILQEVAQTNRNRAAHVGQAIQYIDSSPPALSDKDLVAAGKKVAQAIKVGNWEGNREPRFNENGDKALVDCQFIAGRDLLIHTATFHKVDGLWKLRGVRETMQALLAHPPAREDKEEEK